MSFQWFDRAYLDSLFGGGSVKVKKQSKPEPKRLWFVCGQKVKANTKSEARSIVKKQRGLKRLPVGTAIKELS